jgi:hypothetical protein
VSRTHHVTSPYESLAERVSRAFLRELEQLLPEERVAVDHVLACPGAATEVHDDEHLTTLVPDAERRDVLITIAARLRTFRAVQTAPRAVRHRQSAPTRLTKHQGWYFPYAQRPRNAGGSNRPSGGYAKDRAEHARYKKIGRRLERRRRNRGEYD